MEEGPMQTLRHVGTLLFLAALILTSTPRHFLAQTDSSATTGQAASEKRDGQHDFDFELGAWKIHLKRLVHPLTGSTTWTEFDGTSVTRKVWDGRAEIEEFETDGAAGHIEGLTLRLYNTQSHQWRLYWANSKNGVLEQPMIGEFKNGRGEFLDQEPFNGRTILVRFVWSEITPNSAHFEQSFSDDGGKTWEVNWITDQTRVKDASDKARSAPSTSDSVTQGVEDLDGQHGFDPLLGSWKYQLKRRLNPLTGSTSWVDFGGTGLCEKVWDGRAELEQAEFDGPGGHIEGLVLRLYNPQSHQWTLNWANSKNGILDPPQIGEFKNGHGEFYAQDKLNGKSILVRFDWSRMNTSSPHFEQAYSADGGKTWEVNWITDQTRVQ
jgi:hypothetical protein